MKIRLRGNMDVREGSIVRQSGKDGDQVVLLAEGWPVVLSMKGDLPAALVERFSSFDGEIKDRAVSAFLDALKSAADGVPVDVQVVLDLIHPTENQLVAVIPKGIFTIVKRTPIEESVAASLRILLPAKSLEEKIAEEVAAESLCRAAANWETEQKNYVLAQSYLERADGAAARRIAAADLYDRLYVG